MLAAKENRPPRSVARSISIEEAVEAAVRSHMNAFASSKCSEECIRAQLNAYYLEKGICKDIELRAINRNGRFHEKKGKKLNV